MTYAADDDDDSDKDDYDYSDGYDFDDDDYREGMTCNCQAPSKECLLKAARQNFARF